MDRIQKYEPSANDVHNVEIINQGSALSLPLVVHAQPSEIKTISKQSTQIISKPTKLLPWTVRFDLWGSSAQVVALPKDKGRSYQTTVHISLLGKIYTVQLQISCPDFSFDRILRARNVVPNDSAITVACILGDFDSAYKLFSSGAAHGSDVTLAGRPMLDVSMNSPIVQTCNTNDMGSMLLRAGLAGLFVCFSNMELILTWHMGSIICE